MNRTRWYFGVSIATLIAACSTPTGTVCACPPSFSAVILRGVLHDRDGHPVPNVRLGFDGIPRGMPRADSVAGPFSGSIARTNADGSFRVVAQSGFGADTLDLRVMLLPDSAFVAWPFTRFPARFRWTPGPLDSLTRTLTLP